MAFLMFHTFYVASINTALDCWVFSWLLSSLFLFWPRLVSELASATGSVIENSFVPYLSFTLTAQTTFECSLLNKWWIKRHRKPLWPFCFVLLGAQSVRGPPLLCGPAPEDCPGQGGGKGLPALWLQPRRRLLQVEYITALLSHRT